MGTGACTRERLQAWASESIQGRVQTQTTSVKGECRRKPPASPPHPLRGVRTPWAMKRMKPNAPQHLTVWFLGCCSPTLCLNCDNRYSTGSIYDFAVRRPSKPDQPSSSQRISSTLATKQNRSTRPYAAEPQLWRWTQSSPPNPIRSSSLQTPHTMAFQVRKSPHNRIRSWQSFMRGPQSAPPGGRSQRRAPGTRSRFGRPRFLGGCAYWVQRCTYVLRIHLLLQFS